jgi:hypothetical protein
MPDVTEVTIVSVTDWIGAYVNGKLAWEHESMSAQDVCRLVGQITSVKLAWVQAAGTELDDAVTDLGGFQENLVDALRATLRKSTGA